MVSSVFNLGTDHTRETSLKGDYLGKHPTNINVLQILPWLFATHYSVGQKSSIASGFKR